jgi:hypothetical protein
VTGYLNVFAWRQNRSEEIDDSNPEADFALKLHGSPFWHSSFRLQ